MPYVERTDEELIEAYERWLERHPKPDQKVLVVGYGSLSPRELVHDMREGHPFMSMLLRLLREGAQELDEDPVEIIDRQGS